ncbi:MAG: phage neck terminator protein [Schwartzia sp. (in: firmicutes)]
MKSIGELETLLWKACARILFDVLKEPDRWIRWKHPTEGLPDWTTEDNVLFLNLAEYDDDYARQRDSTYHGERGTIIKRTDRTRVWELFCTAYGPRAYEIANALRDGFFLIEIERLLGENAVFLVPDLPICRQINESFAGSWWTRWDVAFHFNEQYTVTEDVGRIERVSVAISRNR